MANITFNTAKISSVANSLRGRVERIENSLKKLDNSCNNIQSIWKGSDSQTYVSKVIEKRNDITKVVNGFKDLANLLDKYAAKMSQNQQDIIDAGSKL